VKLRQLRSLVTILDSGSFAAAGDRVGLSHAAISVQMQQLEASLGVDLFDRSNRPARLTASGLRIARLAAEVLAKIENIKQEAIGAATTGSVSIGFIPTSVHNLLPRVLDALRRQFPELQVSVKSGLSSELATAVVRHELDYALVTTPLVEIPELEITEIASEPFYVIGPAGIETDSDSELLRSMPYIAFNKRTWVGQHIAAKLQQRGIHVTESIEIDSLEAIENLVADGFGVSIVPRRLHARQETGKLLQIPFGNPIDTRQLTLIQHMNKPLSRFDTAIKSIFLDLPKT